MSLHRIQFIRAARVLEIYLACLAIGVAALAQSVSTTTVQGTVYLANGLPGSGTLQVSWPAFTTASSQAIAAGKITATIGADGFVSVNLAPNLGSSPAGLYYTAIYHMSDGTISSDYWVVPAAAQASIAQVRSQVMPAAQALQAVSKAYVDQAIQSIAQGNLTSTGGQLTGPLYLTGDPTQSLQAADKHYVDSSLSQAVPLTGGAVNGPLTAQQLGAAYQVDQFPGADFGGKLQACLGAINGSYGGTCDARNFSGILAMGANLAISTANTTVMLPCATISTASQIIVTAGTRNVSLRGCALRGASNASGSQGGTVLLYSGAAAAVQVGDQTYTSNTLGFHLDNVVVNTTAATSANAQAFAAYRTQEIDLESLYLLGNANQTGITLDGTGNYTGGTFFDTHISGFQSAINGIGHQITNPATTDWLNASSFVRLHIDCPTTGGNPVAGTYGVNLQQGDGNTFTGGDVENCGTAVHLGANAQNNTIVGLRNENSTNQVVADAGSSYNSWMTGGTMFTGKLTDNGTRNSFLDAFHRSFNSLNGDWYGSQQDATLTNHYRLGIGNGNERGLLDRYQTDNGYRWTTGLSDATGGEQFYQVLDELNGVYRLSIGQYNNGQTGTNNQTVVNSAGTGAVVLNGSNNAGTGGVVFGSGGANESTVATVSNAGSAQFNGTLQVGGTTQSSGTMTVRNNADNEVDYYLWPGLSSSQKGSFTYKDWNGSSQWYMLKDASNNWSLNSAVGGLDSLKAYQSTNSGDTYINASNASGVVRVNYETGAGSAFNVYGGSSANLYASFSGNSSIKFPGLSASSGHNCLQIDASGYITNTGAACSSGGSGTVNSGSTGQIAYYNGNGAAVSGMSTIPVSAGGTGASTAIGALAALGGVSMATTATQSLAGPLNASVNSQVNVMVYGAKGDCVTDDQPAIAAAQTAAQAFATGFSSPAALYFPKPPGGCYYLANPLQWTGVSVIGQPSGGGISSPSTYGVVLKSAPGKDVFHVPDPTVTSFKWNATWTIRDITFMEDATAAGSYPHRWPGRWFDDAAMTAGSAVLSTSHGSIGCSDVGQAIQVNGAGPSGTNLVTAIASVDPCWANVGSTGSWKVITLAANASTTVTNAHTYISVLGLPVTTTVGNCGIAMDDKDGNSADFVNPGQSIGSLYSTMENVAFTGFDGPANNVCGIYTQGAHSMYGLTVDHFNIPYQTFGVVQGAAELNSFDNSDTGDFQTWKHGLFGVTVNPWINYNGGNMRWEDVEMTVQSGPQFLSLGNMWADLPENYSLNISEFETWGTPSTYGLRLTGLGHTLNDVEIAPGGMNGGLDMSASMCNGCFTGGNTPSYLYGYMNHVTGMSLGTPIIDKGMGNTVTGSYAGSYLYGHPITQELSFLPMKGRDDIIGSSQPDFINDGYTATPYKHADLWLWPKEFLVGNNAGANPWSSYYQDDPNSVSGGEFYIASGSNLQQWSQFSGNSDYLTVGANFPASTGTLYYQALCPAGATTLNVGVTSSDGYTQGYATPAACTTSLALYSVAYNLTGHTGNVGIKNFLGTGVWLAWAYFQPTPNLPAGTLFNGLTLAGAGAGIVTGPNAGTTANDLVTENGTNGQIKDSGKVIGGAGAAVVTGPSSGTSPGDMACYSDTAGTHADCNTFGTLNLINATSGPSFNFGSTATGSNTQFNLKNGDTTHNDLFGYYMNGTRYWYHGTIGSTNFQLFDSVNGHSLLNFPSNTMPANSIGGNSNGATAITQASTDNSTNIATDAFVKSSLPLSGTTASIGGSSLALGACTSGTVNITGATTSMAVVASPATYPGDGMVWRPYVSAAGVVTVKVCASVAGTPTASTYNVRVIP